MLSIVTTLQSGAAWTPARLATHFGTSERTIYRDLDRLRGAGVPVAFDRDTGRYRIDGAFYMPPVRLTADETDALVALTGHLEGERAAGPPCPATASRALRKVLVRQAAHGPIGPRHGVGPAGSAARRSIGDPGAARFRPARPRART